MNFYKLTVHCITYNHEKFIAQALDGFVSQKTDFPFQVIVSDDHSTDSTSDIIREYALRFPEIIKPVLLEKNVGIWENFVQTSDRIHTQYVAMCEGDDYWIDERKLQKQVDFLDSHPECSICFHPVRMEYDDSRPSSVFPEVAHRFSLGPSTLDDLLGENFMQTNSVVYRWRFQNGGCLRELLPKNIMPLDYYLHLLHAELGGVGFIENTMGVYRVHSGGVWYQSDLNKFYLKNGIQHLNFYSELEKRYSVSMQYQIAPFARLTLQSLLRAHRFPSVIEFQEKYPKFFEAALMDDSAFRAMEHFEKVQVKISVQKYEIKKAKRQLHEVTRRSRRYKRYFGILMGINACAFLAWLLFSLCRH